MGVRITGGNEAVLYDSVTGRAFGSVFSDSGDAQSFLDWLDHRGFEDARLMSVTDLEEEYAAWQADQAEYVG